MEAVLTRLLALALLAGGVVAVSAAPALADCPAPQQKTLEQHTMVAHAIFTGTVTHREVQGDDRVYTVDVERVYKGDVPAEATVTTPAKAAQCGLRLDADADYVFLATDTDGDLSVDSRDGTSAATDARVAHLEGLLGPGAPATEPEPATATFTLVAGEKASVSRLAAPGLALVIVGLLGLLLAAALGRRRG